MASSSDVVGVKLALEGLTSFVGGMGEATKSVGKVASSISDVNKRIGGGSSFGVLGRAVSGFTGVARKAAQVLGVGTLIGGGLSLAAGIRSVVSEANNMAKALAQTRSVLQSTGGAAGVTTSQVQSLAKQVQSYSGIQDATVIGAENLLLGFTGIRNSLGAGNDIFNRASKAAADMSVRLGRDLPTSALTLGKALQNPLTGLMMLRRSAIVFSTAQQDAIKSLTKSGDLLGAQRIIMAQVEKQVGGAAKAYGDTFPGALARLRASARSAFGDFATTVEKTLSGPLAHLSDWFATFVDKTLPGFLGGVSGAVSGIVGRAGSAFAARGSIHGAAGWGETLDNVVGGQGKLTDTFRRLVQAAMDIWHIFTVIRPTLEDIARVAGGALLTAFRFVADVLHVLANHASVLNPLLWGLAGALVAMQAVSTATDIVKGVTGMVKGLRGALDSIKGLLGIGEKAVGSTPLEVAAGTMETAANTMFAAAQLMAKAAGVPLAEQATPAEAAVGGTSAFGGILGVVGGAGGLAALSSAGNSVANKIAGKKDTGIGSTVRKDIAKFAPAGLPGIPVLGSNVNVALAEANRLRRLLPFGHTGAYVDSAGMVVIRQDEAVVAPPSGAEITPTAAGARMPRSADTGGGDLHVHVNLDGKQVTSAVVRNIRSELARR